MTVAKGAFVRLVGHNDLLRQVSILAGSSVLGHFVIDELSFILVHTHTYKEQAGHLSLEIFGQDSQLHGARGVIMAGRFNLSLEFK